MLWLWGHELPFIKQLSLSNTLLISHFSILLKKIKIQLNTLLPHHINYNMCRLSYLKYNTKLDMKKKTFLHNVLPRYKCKLSKVSRENFKLADYWPKTYRFSERPYIMTPFVEKISHYQYALTLILSTWPSVKVNCKLPNYKVWPIQN